MIKASVDNPIAHLTGGQRDGDAYDVLPNVNGTREA